MSMPLSPPMQPRPIEFELDVTIPEHVRALRVAQRRGFARGRELRRTQWTAAVAGAGMLLWMFYSDDGVVSAAEWLLAALVVLCLPAAMLMSNVLLVRWAVRGPRRVALSDTGVRLEDPLGAAHLPWSAVREVREEAGLLLLDAGAKGLFPVPLRVLQRAGVLDEARNLVARARGVAADLAGVPGPAADSVDAAGAPPPHGAIVITFTPTRWECSAVSRLAWFRSPIGRVVTASLFLVPVAGLALHWGVGGPAAVRDNLYLLAAAPVGLAFARAAGLFTLARTGMVPVHVTFDAVGIEYNLDGVRETTSWSAIRRVQRVGGLLLFWADRNVPLWVPMRGLGSSADDVSRLIREHAGARAAL